MSPAFKRRVYEILPGALVWITLIGSVVFSFTNPLIVIGFIIVFDVFWLIRIAYYAPFLLVSWWRYRHALKHDWQHDAERLPGYDKIMHLVMLPTWKEDISIIRGTLNTILATTTPNDRFIICLGGEERDQENFLRFAEIIKREYEHQFARLIITLHPDPRGKPDEIQGKGSNLHWMASQIAPIIEEMGISPDHLIVSSFDVDTIMHVQYFACVTCAYLTSPDPTRSSYQPVALYNNNLWDAKAPVRVAMFGTTFWLMSELARPEQMMTFSSHSMSWRMLLDVGFWQKDIVSEDSRIFLQAFARYHGDYRVTPIYLPISMDSVDSVNYAGSLLALYKQMRRWAWGVENFVYMMENFLPDKKVPLRLKLIYLWKQLEGSYTWATAPLLITILGRLPFWLASDAYRASSMFQNTPFTLQRLMQFSLLGAFISAALALTLLPPRPAHVSRPYALATILLQWILLPVTGIFFGSIPAIEAQTRHMLGGRFRLGFNVTQKSQRKNS
jgi:hypothetical protein